MEKITNKSPSKKKGLSILILHAFWYDRGDEAAIRAMIDSLRSELPVRRMRIEIVGCKTVPQFPYDDVEIVGFPSSRLSAKKNRLLPPIVVYSAALLTLFTFGKLSLTRQWREFIEAVNEADVIIHAPAGPRFGDLYGGRLSRDFPDIYRLLICKVSRNKPFFLYASSMGPFSGRFRNFIRRFAIKRADAIIVREEISARYLKEQLGLDSYVTVDSALQNDIPEDYISRYTNISEILNIIENEKVIGIIITDLKWHPVYGKYSGLAERIRSSFVGLIQYLINKGYAILLIPIMFGERLDTHDVLLLEDIYSLIRKEKETEKKIFLLPSDVDAYAQQVIISKLFCVISVRYHGVVFSAKGEVPFIAVSYEHKIKGFVQKTGLTELMINVEELSGNKLIDKFTYLEENYAIIKEQLKNKVPLLKEESRKTTKILAEKLRGKGLV